MAGRGISHTAGISINMHTRETGNAYLHDDATGILVANADIEVYLRVRHFGCKETDARTDERRCEWSERTTTSERRSQSQALSCAELKGHLGIRFTTPVAIHHPLCFSSTNFIGRFRPPARIRHLALKTPTKFYKPYTDLPASVSVGNFRKNCIYLDGLLRQPYYMAIYSP